MPITFLTASDEEVNMIMGLDIDGDDYITKPFKLGVLVSHINSGFVSAIVKSTWIFVKSTRPPLRISDIIFTEDK